MSFPTLLEMLCCANARIQLLVPVEKAKTLAICSTFWTDSCLVGLIVAPHLTSRLPVDDQEGSGGAAVMTCEAEPKTEVPPRW